MNLSRLTTCLVLTLSISVLWGCASPRHAAVYEESPTWSGQRAGYQYGVVSQIEQLSSRQNEPEDSEIEYSKPSQGPGCHGPRMLACITASLNAGKRKPLDGCAMLLERFGGARDQAAGVTFDLADPVLEAKLRALWLAHPRASGFLRLAGRGDFDAILGTTDANVVRVHEGLFTHRTARTAPFKVNIVGWHTNYQYEGFDAVITETSQRLDLLALDMAAEWEGDTDNAPDAIAVALPRYLNNRASSIYAGSNEIQRDLIARVVVG